MVTWIVFLFIDLHVSTHKWKLKGGNENLSAHLKLVGYLQEIAEIHKLRWRYLCSNAKHGDKAGPFLH